MLAKGNCTRRVFSNVNINFGKEDGQLTDKKMFLPHNESASQNNYTIRIQDEGESKYSYFYEITSHPTVLDKLGNFS